MDKKWKIDLFFEKYLGEYYKTMPNGKKELFGVDGANHGVYAMLIAFGFGVIGFFGDKFFMLKAMTAGLMVVVVLFFLLEAGQEAVRLKKHRYKGNPLLWFMTKNAQYNDFVFPVVAYYLLSCVIIIIKGLTTIMV